jgi:hypothetical protein
VSELTESSANWPAMALNVARTPIVAKPHDSNSANAIAPRIRDCMVHMTPFASCFGTHSAPDAVVELRTMRTPAVHSSDDVALCPHCAWASNCARDARVIEKSGQIITVGIERKLIEVTGPIRLAAATRIEGQESCAAWRTEHSERCRTSAPIPCWNTNGTPAPMPT